MKQGLVVIRDTGDKKEIEIKPSAKGAATGAAAGASVGARVGGPVGAVVGRSHRRNNWTHFWSRRLRLRVFVQKGKDSIFLRRKK